MGVHPKVIQSIMRHGDINLTMSRYTHLLHGQQAEAIAKLLSLAVADAQAQKATGTDGKTATKIFAKISDILSAGQCATVRDDAQGIGAGAIENRVFNGAGGIRTPGAFRLNGFQDR